MTQNDDLHAGDLWWNAENGKLYIYFQDADSSQWVQANPTASRPLFGASDEPFSYSGAPHTGFSSPQVENKVTISEAAPDARTDGSANEPGDLWWSSTTGMLYIWSQGQDCLTTTRVVWRWTAEWVATDPLAAKNTKEGLGDTSQYEDFLSNPGVEYTGDVTVLISESAPLIMPNGDALAPGTLWWSPISGRLYIFYTDINNSQWVATNTSSTTHNTLSILSSLTTVVLSPKRYLSCLSLLARLVFGAKASTTSWLVTVLSSLSVLLELTT